MTIPLGPWDPIPVANAVALFRPAEFRWWISGGIALEMHVGKSWRAHDDTDISICRFDAPRLHEVLRGWDICFAAAGELSPYGGQVPDSSKSQNNLWARPDPSSPWALDLPISDGTDQEWVYRRRPTVRRPWPDAVLQSKTDALPFLAPELQLLFKSKGLRPKDTHDAEVVIPTLTQAGNNFLTEQLDQDHPWRGLLAASKSS